MCGVETSKTLSSVLWPGGMECCASCGRACSRKAFGMWMNQGTPPPPPPHTFHASHSTQPSATTDNPLDPSVSLSNPQLPSTRGTKHGKPAPNRNTTRSGSNPLWKGWTGHLPVSSNLMAVMRRFERRLLIWNPLTYLCTLLLKFFFAKSLRQQSLSFAAGVSCRSHCCPADQMLQAEPIALRACR